MVPTGQESTYDPPFYSRIRTCFDGLFGGHLAVEVQVSSGTYGIQIMTNKWPETEAWTHQAMIGTSKAQMIFHNSRGSENPAAKYFFH